MSPEAVLIEQIEHALGAPRDRALIVGLCGAQGSGKSTLAAAIAARFAGSVALSLDDLYLTRAARQQLAIDVHPLLATRGVPGTHDVDLGIATLERLARGLPVALPRFDKATDDRVDPRLWSVIPECVRLVIFEGWCVGARPQPDAVLVTPVNELERTHDPSGRWRRYVNAALAGGYQRLFAPIDHLVLLRAPSWAQVLVWRQEQEAALRRSGAGGAGVMSDAEVAQFVSHYERLTRNIMDHMPAYAHTTIQLDYDRAAAEIHRARDGRGTFMPLWCPKLE